MSCANTPQTSPERHFGVFPSSPSFDHALSDDDRVGALLAFLRRSACCDSCCDRWVNWLLDRRDGLEGLAGLERLVMSLAIQIGLEDRP